MTTFKPDVIAVQCAELVLKGQNRARFEKRLREQIARRLKTTGLRWPVRRIGGRIVVEIGDNVERPDAVLDMLGTIPGIATYFPAMRFSAEHFDNETTVLNGAIGTTLLDLARRKYAPQARFAVRAKRHQHIHGLSTSQLERQLGQRILEETAWTGVNLSAPDVTFHLMFYSDHALIYAQRLPGLGGLPVGTSGRVISLLSGGIDSPVATYLMARRGCAMECFHFSANYIDRDNAANTVVGRLAQKLSRYTQSLTLHVAPYVPFDLALTGKPDGYEMLLFRRFIVRTASALAARRRAGALVTGDCLSQVASQTLDNLATLRSATSLPLLQPLIGLSKDEIITRARDIGTYDTSIEPYKDCCALLGRRPRTRANVEKLEYREAERIPHYQRYVDMALEETVSIHYRFGERISVHH